MENFIYSNLENFQPQFCLARKVMMCNRLILKTFRKHIDKHDITISQLSILFITSKKKLILQVELSEMLALEKSTLSRNIPRLLENNYIERSPTKKKGNSNDRKR